MVTAILVISQACQDVRLNRQAAVNLTLAGFVMVVVPAFVCGARCLVSRSTDISVDSRSNGRKES